MARNSYLYGVNKVVENMIYLDNAATTMKKPKEVVDAVTNALCTIGNSGRGAYNGALQASRVIFETRMGLASMFHIRNPKQIAFTANATQSLNIAIKGVLKPGDHVISTQLEHNSVLRPLYEMERMGVELTILKCDAYGRLDYREIENSIKENTKAIVSTHASNVTGNLVDLFKIGEIARRRNLILIVDASQTAGAIPIDVEKMNVDILCFTGHKSLLGPQGTGGIYVREGICVKPLLTGGSGVQSFSKTHPEQMPTALEAGTLNAHGIAGLGAAIKYIDKIGMDAIYGKEQKLMWEFYQQICKLDGIKIYGDFSTKARSPIVSINIRDYDSHQVSDVLFSQYNIATRPGAHCAPLMHEALGTVKQGMVRFSFSYYNTKQEVEQAVFAVKEIAKL